RVPGVVAAVSATEHVDPERLHDFPFVLLDSCGGGLSGISLQNIHPSTSSGRTALALTIAPPKPFALSLSKGVASGLHRHPIRARLSFDKLRMNGTRVDEHPPFALSPSKGGAPRSLWWAPPSVQRRQAQPERMFAFSTS